MKITSTTYFDLLPTPLGPMVAVADEKNILALMFEDQWDVDQKNYPGSVPKKTDLHQILKKQLKEYFQGHRFEFDVPVQLHGTDFQKKVWNSLKKIPYGQVMTYSQQAVQIQKPKALRASARANGANPVCILYPCHRVVGKDGSLTGYAGGLHRKDFLLKLEEKNSEKRGLRI